MSKYKQSTWSLRVFLLSVLALLRITYSIDLYAVSTATRSPPSTVSRLRISQVKAHIPRPLPKVPPGPLTCSACAKAPRKAPYCPLYSDILIHDQRWEEEGKKSSETNSGRLTNYLHISPLAPTSQLHLIGNTLLCLTRTFMLVLIHCQSFPFWLLEAWLTAEGCPVCSAEVNNAPFVWYGGKVG